MKRFKLPAMVVVALAVCSGMVVLFGRPFIGVRPNSDHLGIMIDVTTCDLGTIVPMKNPMVSHTFRGTNKSPIAHKLSLLRKSCGCLLLEFPDVVPPESDFEVHVRAETRRLQGHDGALIILSTSDETLPTIDLTFRFSILPELRIVPPALTFINVPIGKPLEKDIQIVVPTALEDRKITLKAQNAAVDIKPLDTTLATDSIHGTGFTCCHFKVRIELSEKESRDKLQFSDWILCESDLLPTGSKYVPIEIVHSRHEFLNGPMSVIVNDSQKVSFKVWSTDGRLFEIERIGCDSDRVCVALLSKGDLNVHELVVTSGDRSNLKTVELDRIHVEVFARGSTRPFRVEVLCLHQR
ncbi:MAG: DUF1573 domain-containing protein [Gemmataceae bacterium]|nr:DUF1573 domain-containing protein [Gemmataceae bacterium]MCI0739703.1 DUF1573 domain-containing protein [Gemmataceae bacterium]